MSNAKMENYFFCNAKVRPSYCKVKTNTCCFNCEHNEACTVLSESKKIYPKPCTSAVIGNDEVCEFAV